MPYAILRLHDRRNNRRLRYRPRNPRRQYSTPIEICQPQSMPVILRQHGRFKTRPRRSSYAGMSSATGRGIRIRPRPMTNDHRELLPRHIERPRHPPANIRRQRIN